MKTVRDINWRDKVALIRADFNVPLIRGQIADDTRIRAALPTLEYILSGGGGMVVLSHLGRPVPGEKTPSLSLAPIAIRLGELLKRKVAFLDEIPNQRCESGDVYLLENTRFQIGEKENDFALARRYAALGDVFVMDAFATAHRAEASTAALACAADSACCGLLVEKEITALDRALHNPKPPIVAVIGGAKISTKISALHRLLIIADKMFTGGGIANTFLLARDFRIGKSLCESSLINEAHAMLDQFGDKLPPPIDVVLAGELNQNAKTRIAGINEVGDDEMILDLGPATRAQISSAIAAAGTVIWSGPVGAFECPPFAFGTEAVARAIAGSSAFSLAGGGDTIAAINQFGAADGISYISTGGGAFLEYLQGGKLPALELPGISALENSAV